MDARNSRNTCHSPVRHFVVSLSLSFQRFNRPFRPSGEQELSKSLILIMEFFESVTTNSQQMLQTDKSSTFTFCQTPIERIVSDINTKDLFPQLMK